MVFCYQNCSDLMLINCSSDQWQIEIPFLTSKLFSNLANWRKISILNVTFLGLWLRSVEVYFHYFFVRFISLSHKEKSFIRHKELKIKIDCECKYYILRKKGLNSVLLKSVNRKNRTQDTQSKLSFKQLTHEIWATLVWDKKALKINAPLA